MKQNVILVCTLCFFLHGCSFMHDTLKGGSDALAVSIGKAPGGSWLGKRSSELVNALGVPDKTMKLEQGEVWEYDGCGASQPYHCHKWLFGIRDGLVVTER